MTKSSQFGEFLKIAACSQTVLSDRTKIAGKCQNVKHSNATFFQTMRNFKKLETYSLNCSTNVTRGWNYTFYTKLYEIIACFRTLHFIFKWESDVPIQVHTRFPSLNLDLVAMSVWFQFDLSHLHTTPIWWSSWHWPSKIFLHPKWRFFIVGAPGRAKFLKVTFDIRKLM